MRKMIAKDDCCFVCRTLCGRVLLAIALLVALRAAPAWAAEATLTSLGVGLYDTVTGTTGGPVATQQFAGSFHIAVDGGASTEAYCVDIHNPLTFGDSQPQVVPDYPCEVVYILGHAYPNANAIGTALADLPREAAAVQSAIWFFTDGFTITGPSDVQARTNEIIGLAKNQCGQIPPVPQELTVTPAEATNYLPTETSHSVTATLRDTNGDPIAQYAVEVTVAGAAGPQTFQGVTDQNGDFVVTYDNDLEVPGTDTITATASFTVPVGLKFKAEGVQGIVVAGSPRPGTVTGTATKHWVPAACGDGVRNQAGEECDDGNLVDGDGCDANCTPTACGNGVLTAGEQCDDGNLLDGDGCDFDCTPTACGNGVVTTGEECDDGNEVNGDECDNNCTAPRCGNGVASPGEQCDDGNATNGDGCDDNCTISACGNGIVTAGEQCDDGNAIDGDGCDHDCTYTGCGNGIVTGNELCDDGNQVDGDLCESNCIVAQCGNGIPDQGEQCDDGNTLDGDGCDATCRLQEVCNDTNDNDGDGAVDCDDTDCGCLQILRDPAVIRFAARHPKNSKMRQRPDFFRVHGRLEPKTAHDVVTEGLTLVVTNANGVIYKARLLPGDLSQHWSTMSFVDKPAARGEGSREGLYRVKIRRGVRDGLVVVIEAYGDFSAATLPAMTIQIGIGDDMFYTKGVFSQRRYGWYWSF